jgi:hypothetical protein
MLHTVVNSCSPAPSHTIRITKSTFIISQWILQANEMTTKKKMPHIYYCIMNEEIKTLSALGSVLNAFTVTLSENSCDWLSNSLTMYLATCAWLLRIPRYVVTADILLYYMYSDIHTASRIQLWYSCCTIFTNHAVAYDLSVKQQHPKTVWDSKYPVPT